MPLNGRRLWEGSLYPEGPAFPHSWNNTGFERRNGKVEINESKSRSCCVYLLKEGRRLTLSKWSWLSCFALSTASFFLQQRTLRGCEWKCSSSASCGDSTKWEVCLTRVARQATSLGATCLPEHPWWSSSRRSRGIGKYSSTPALLSCSA